MEGDMLIGGRYRLLDRLGAGGMSVVWRAQDDVLDRDVAVKVLSPSLAADPNVLRRIYAEARAAAGLRHPNVVGVYDYGETDDGGRPVPYVVMELVSGRSLTDLLSGGPLPWRSAVLIGAQVAAALSAAHAHGIVHRDVKPANVMVTASGVKLVDFGISAAIGEADMAEGQLLGTPAYLAPERLDGGQVRPATDVYAVGLLLYLSLAGRLPWQASTTTQMIAAHLYREPSALPPVIGLPPEIADLCHRCLAKDPADRPTAADAAEALGVAVGLPPASLLLGGSAPISEDDLDTTMMQSRRRKPAPVLVAGGIVAALALGGAVALSTAGANGNDEKAVAAPVTRPVACTVDYTIRSAAGGRSSTAVTISNTGQVAMDTWRLSFSLPGRQRLVRGWSGTWRQAGVDVLAYGGTLPVGGSVATGFDALYRDVAALPAQFLLNGTACRSVLSVRSQTVTTATTPARATTRAAGNGDLGRAGQSKSAKSKSGKSKGGANKEGG